MHPLYYLIPRKSSSHIAQKKNPQKAFFSLTTYVYAQTTIAMIAATFCAVVVLIALYEPSKSNFLLFFWSGVFLAVVAARILLAYLYQRYGQNEKNTVFWRNLYTFGSLCGGISWGLTGILLLPNISGVQQPLLILMLAGVTAGAVPLSAGIPAAAIAFLIAALLPYIIVIALSGNHTYYLFDMALCLYLGYSIILTLKAYKIVLNSVLLQFENSLLIDDLEIINKKLAQAATHDPLTQVANRRLFLATFEKAILSAKDNKSLVALFYIDLDNFKAANDNHGHHMGDHILIVVIDRLKNYFRKHDMIARLGGDELAIIIEHIHTKHEVETIARKICQLVALPIQANNLSLHISASVGISIYPYDGPDEDTLIRSADKSMYVAKKGGGNKYALNPHTKEFI